ncbi:MAG: type II secretion system protein [Planctomycetota bacterium]
MTAWARKAAGTRNGGGFTVVELLVVVGTISLVAAILLDPLVKVRRKANRLKCMSNQRQIACAVNLFAEDNEGRYPESVATSGFGNHWHFEEPTALTGYNIRAPGLHRTVSEYLRRYIKDATIMFCPNAPRRYKYLQQSWDTGDAWNNPDTPGMGDPVFGTYCFYWNYNGYLGAGRKPFKGPWSPASRGTQSRLLVSDYLGYDTWRRRDAYFSCESFKCGDIAAETWYYSAYWSAPNPAGTCTADGLKVVLSAAYTDTHVERYSASQTIPMWVSTTPDGGTPDTVGPGIFYMPRKALR